MPQQNFALPPKRGRITIRIIKGLWKSAANFLSTGSGRRRARRERGGGLSSSSTTPGHATPNDYNSDGSLDSLG
ncbi:hypothetical protein QQP08_027390 [Theobroma cacao]|nr:hypothetical protein QQP08_027390 [Theobroma cacao]